MQAERKKEKGKEESRDVCCKGERETEKEGTNGKRRQRVEEEERTNGKRREGLEGEEERTNGRRREGQGKRKGEEKREQQLLLVAESTWGYDKSLSASPGTEIPSTTVTMGRSACHHLVTTLHH